MKRQVALLLLLGGLGHLALTFLLLDIGDHTDGDGLPHVTDGKTTERSILGVLLNAHRLGRLQDNHGGIARLDEIGILTNGFSGTAVNLLGDLGELAGNVRGVAIQNGSVSGADLSRVVEDNHLRGEVGSALGGVILGITSDVSTADLLDRHTLDVETNVVTRKGLGERFVVHFDRLDLSSQLHGSEGHNHARLQDPSLDTTDGYGTDTANLVDVLQRNTEGKVGGPLGGGNAVQGVNEGSALVPLHVGGVLQHVISVPARDGDEGNLLGVVSDLLQETGHFLLNLLEPVLAVLHRLVVHLVDGDNHLLHTEGKGQKGVLASLPVLGNTSLEF